jgi:hypothetical protein
MVCVEIVDEEMVGVADDADVDAWASQVIIISEWQASGDAGFRRSASEM